MKKTWQCLLFTAAILATASTQAQNANAPLPAGTVQRGTFASPQLIKDTQTGVVTAVAARGCNHPAHIMPYVVVEPKGATGWRTWKERWVVSGCGHQYPVNISFQETGPGKGANYYIQKFGE